MLSDERPAVHEDLRRALRPIRVSTVITRWNTTRNTNGVIRRETRPSTEYGRCPVSRPESHVAWPWRASSIAISAPELPAPDDECTAPAQLARVAILARMQLHDVGASSAAKAGIFGV
jgi:hypothetical protein